MSPASSASRYKSSEGSGSSSTIRPAVVYETYWKFAAERQAIFFRRLGGQQEPWTDDPILHQHKFTNAYRASDRVSQYLIRHVIYQGQDGSHDGAYPVDDPDDLFFRVLLFKFFNCVSTWQKLEEHFGPISYAEYTFEQYDAVLSGLKESGHNWMHPLLTLLGMSKELQCGTRTLSLCPKSISTPSFLKLSGASRG